VGESIDEFLKRGGVIKKVETPKHNPDTRSDYSAKDKIDVVVGVKRKYGASKMFDRFAKGFLGKGNNNWKYQK
jgi:hypothetical protein